MNDANKPTPETYEEPVARLLTIGEPRGEWPDYPAEYGLTAADVPALVQMVQDEGLHWANEDETEVWAPMHAWRALGQLQAAEAVPGLLDGFYMIEEWDFHYMMDEMPEVMGMIGPAALPALAEFLGDPEQGVWARSSAANGIVAIARRHPAARERAIEHIAGQLSHYDTQDPTLNALLVSDLTDLHAVEAQEVIEAAFAADAVDLTVQGDWEEVQIELGLLEERLTPLPEDGWNPVLHKIAETVKKMAAKQEAVERIEKKRQQQEWGKIGRNDPCPCGSGRKYKRCHGRPGA